MADWRFGDSEADERQMSYADAGFGHSDHCAGPEVITTLFEHTGQEIRERFGLQPIDADANHGRPRRARKRQLGMEICVQGDDDLTMVPSTREDGSVVGVGKADVADVFSGQARVAQVKCGGARQALVEEQRQGATTGGRILSSR